MHDRLARREAPRERGVLAGTEQGLDVARDRHQHPGRLGQGLGLGGEAGAQRVLQLLKDECDLALGLAGGRTVADLTRDLVVT